jgi:hypothetical protein
VIPLAHALAKAKEDGDKPESDDDEPDYDKHGEAAMDEFISAVHSKDAEAAWSALKTCVELCGHSEPDGDEDDDGGGSHAALMLIPHKG